MALFSRNIKSCVLRTCHALRYNVSSHNGLHSCVLQTPHTVAGFTRTQQAGRSSIGRHTLYLAALPSLRLNSTHSIGGAPAGLPDGYIPEPPPIPTEQLAQLQGTGEQILNSLGEPTLSSLGLCSYTPSGFIQWSLENMHVGLDLPWWGAVMMGTVIIRCCVFPLVILGQRNSANMANHMPTVQRLQEKMTQSRAGGNPMEAARCAAELQDYMSRNKVNPLKGMMVPMAQVPIFMSVFFGLRKMANLPVESLTTGGMLWFTDLTIADPYFALPIVTMATLLLTVEAGVDGVNTATMTKNMKMFMRAMPFFVLPFMINFPTVLCCYWFTSNCFSLMQVMVLKIPAVKEFFKIPTVVKHTHAYDLKKQLPKKGFVQGLKESWSNQKMLATLEQRQRADEDNFKKAGKTAIVKTYKQNPKIKAKVAVKAKS